MTIGNGSGGGKFIYVYYISKKITNKEHVASD